MISTLQQRPVGDLLASGTRRARQMAPLAAPFQGTGVSAARARFRSLDVPALVVTTVQCTDDVLTLVDAPPPRGAPV